MESFFNIKNFKSHKKVMQTFFSISNVKSHRKVTESFFGIKNFKTVIVSSFSIKNLKSRKKVTNFFFSITLKVVRKWLSPFFSVKNFNLIQDGLFRGCSRMGIFQGCSRMGWEKKTPLPKICHTYPTMLKLDTVITCLKKIQKIYESRDTPLEFSWYQYFFTGNPPILPYQEMQI